MKKFDFVAELLAHGFHDDTKLEAVELSRQTGFEGVVLTQNLCRAKFFDGGIEYKCKWYYTAGKRTYNAIVATLQNAGLEI